MRIRFVKSRIEADVDDESASRLIRAGEAEDAEQPSDEQERRHCRIVQAPRTEAFTGRPMMGREDSSNGNARGGGDAGGG